MEIKINFREILTLVFVIFKLLNKINWSWIWVFGPIWIGFIIDIIKIILSSILEAILD